MRIVFEHIAGIIIAVFFFYAGSIKLIDPSAFYESILNYQFVSGNIAWQSALIVPWLEVFTGIAILFKATRTAALTWISLLLLVFQVILFSAYFRGLNIDCGCLGSTNSISVEFALIRNFLLIGLVCFVFFSWQRTEQLKKTTPSKLST